MRAANEMGKKTVAVYAEEDKLCLHRFKADEAYHIGDGLGPVAAYLSIEEIIRVAKMSGSDAIHPGYGLLSENPELVDACVDAGLTFIGPSAKTMRQLGDKASARKVAMAAAVPVVPATDVLPKDMKEIYVEGADAYKETKKYMSQIMPSCSKFVKAYKNKIPLFSKYQVD